MGTEDQFGRLKLIGRLSLWFSLVAAAGLLGVVWLAGPPAETYLQHVQSLALTQRHLPITMLLCGLLLAVGTGLTTWLIVLYSSFRVAGPLYRFARNLEAGAQTGAVPRIRIRHTDYLQAECRALEEAVAAVEAHRGSLDNALQDALAETTDPRRRAAALRRIDQVLDLARLD